MKLIKEKGLNILKADEGKKLRGVNDKYIPATEEEPEHVPYDTDTIYLAVQIDTLEKAQELYTEVITELGGN